MTTLRYDSGMKATNLALQICLELFTRDVFRFLLCLWSEATSPLLQFFLAINQRSVIEFSDGLNFARIPQLPVRATEKVKVSTKHAPRDLTFTISGKNAEFEMTKILKQTFS